MNDDIMDAFDSQVQEDFDRTNQDTIEWQFEIVPGVNVVVNFGSLDTKQWRPCWSMSARNINTGEHHPEVHGMINTWLEQNQMSADHLLLPSVRKQVRFAIKWHLAWS